MTLGKHGVHLSLLIILFQPLGQASDRSPLASQAATRSDSAAQQSASSEPREKHSIQGQVVVLALQSAGRTRLVLSASGKNGQTTIEFVMTSESQATPGLKKGANVIVAYHDHKENNKKVHLVSFVRVVVPPPGPVSVESNPASGPKVTPLSPEQGAVTENIPGVFERNWRPSHQGGGGHAGALIGGLAGGGKGAAIGAEAGAAAGTKGSSASTASGQAVKQERPRARIRERIRARKESKPYLGKCSLGEQSSSSSIPRTLRRTRTTS